MSSPQPQTDQPQPSTASSKPPKTGKDNPPSAPQSDSQRWRQTVMGNMLADPGFRDFTKILPTPHATAPLQQQRNANPMPYYQPWGYDTFSSSSMSTGSSETQLNRQHEWTERQALERRAEKEAERVEELDELDEEFAEVEVELNELERDLDEVEEELSELGGELEKLSKEGDILEDYTKRLYRLISKMAMLEERRDDVEAKLERVEERRDAVLAKLSNSSYNGDESDDEYDLRDTALKNFLDTISEKLATLRRNTETIIKELEDIRTQVSNAARARQRAVSGGNDPEFPTEQQSTAFSDPTPLDPATPVARFAASYCWMGEATERDLARNAQQRARQAQNVALAWAASSSTAGQKLDMKRKRDEVERNGALADYQMQLMILEQQNKKRFMGEEPWGRTASGPQGQSSMENALSAPGRSAAERAAAHRALDYQMELRLREQDKKRLQLQAQQRERIQAATSVTHTGPTATWHTFFAPERSAAERSLAQQTIAYYQAQLRLLKDQAALSATRETTSATRIAERSLDVYAKQLKLLRNEAAQSAAREGIPATTDTEVRAMRRLLASLGDQVMSSAAREKIPVAMSVPYAGTTTLPDSGEESPGETSTSSGRVMSSSGPSLSVRNGAAEEAAEKRLRIDTSMATPIAPWVEPEPVPRPIPPFRLPSPVPDPTSPVDIQTCFRDLNGNWVGASFSESRFRMPGADVGAQELAPFPAPMYGGFSETYETYEPSYRVTAQESRSTRPGTGVGRRESTVNQLPPYRQGYPSAAEMWGQAVREEQKSPEAGTVNFDEVCRDYLEATGVVDADGRDGNASPPASSCDATCGPPSFDEHDSESECTSEDCKISERCGCGDFRTKSCCGGGPTPPRPSVESVEDDGYHDAEMTQNAESEYLEDDEEYDPEDEDSGYSDDDGMEDDEPINDESVNDELMEADESNDCRTPADRRQSDKCCQSGDCFMSSSEEDESEESPASSDEDAGHAEEGPDSDEEVDEASDEDDSGTFRPAESDLLESSDTEAEDMDVDEVQGLKSDAAVAETRKGYRDYVKPGYFPMNDSVQVCVDSDEEQETSDDEVGEEDVCPAVREQKVDSEQEVDTEEDTDSEEEVDFEDEFVLFDTEEDTDSEDEVGPKNEADSKDEVDSKLGIDQESGHDGLLFGSRFEEHNKRQHELAKMQAELMARVQRFEAERRLQESAMARAMASMQQQVAGGPLQGEHIKRQHEFAKRQHEFTKRQAEQMARVQRFEAERQRERAEHSRRYRRNLMQLNQAINRDNDVEMTVNETAGALLSMSRAPAQHEGDEEVSESPPDDAPAASGVDNTGEEAPADSDSQPGPRTTEPEPSSVSSFRDWVRNFGPFKKTALTRVFTRSNPQTAPCESSGVAGIHTETNDDEEESGAGLGEDYVMI